MRKKKFCAVELYSDGAKLETVINDQFSRSVYWDNDTGLAPTIVQACEAPNTIPLYSFFSVKKDLLFLQEKICKS